MNPVYQSSACHRPMSMNEDRVRKQVLRLLIVGESRCSAWSLLTTDLSLIQDTLLPATWRE